MNADHERANFIMSNTRLLAVPLTREIVLHLADDVTTLWQMTEDELKESGLPPPFWAFAWAGGQALARYVLDNPEIVCGKRVLDFAAGSGLVGIAAALAGAAHVEACDIDAFAISSVGVNARANKVTIDAKVRDLVGVDENWDVVLAGDVSYERDMAARVTNWLGGLAQRGANVLVGDPGRTYLAKNRLEPLTEYIVPVSRDLEDSDTKIAKVWKFANSE